MKPQIPALSDPTPASSFGFIKHQLSYFETLQNVAEADVEDGKTKNGGDVADSHFGVSKYYLRLSPLLQRL